MKIGITCYPTYGGSGVVATELGMKLATMGHQVHFISYALPYRLSNFTTNVYFHEVDVLQYPLFEYPPYSLSLAHKMAEVIEFEKLDILHVHYAIPHATSAHLAKEILEDKGFKFVTTLHGTDITLIGSDPSYLKIVKFSIEKSDGVTAVSKYLADKTYQTFNVKNEIEVIPNFVPDKFLELDITKRDFCYKKSNEIIMTHISNFRPLKRVTDLVYVMEKLVKKNTHIRLLMVGDGPDRARMEMLCREMNLCDHITFLGKQENVENVLASSDLFLLPSAEESFGLAVLEALACGVPCVTTNAGGLPEVNIHGETGFNVNIGDIDAFADAVYEIISDRQVAKKFSENARILASEKYGSDKIVPQYLDYYSKIIS
ncbi:MAG: N-acetyl-alpha-D-glucosaminyl L-malate synthase BshA [Calditrichaeota bacterium]|nr:N-acetyl-alpha-D-glucosaminyl L-malate synthase BshA [Calditrichota bacterium]